MIFVVVSQRNAISHLFFSQLQDILSLRVIACSNGYVKSHVCFVGMGQTLGLYTQELDGCYEKRTQMSVNPRVLDS